MAFATGYSILELERAAITEEQARTLGLAVDRQRTSALGANVLQLKNLRQTNRKMIKS